MARNTRRHLAAIAAAGVFALCSACASGAADSTKKLDRTIRTVNELEERVAELEKELEAEAGHTSAAKEGLHWSYTGSGTGPDKWATLDPSYAACTDGSAQSPVNLDKAKVVQVPDLKLDYAPTAAAVIDNGHTIQVDLKTDKHPTLVLDGVKYKLAQLHFHGPSEHTVNGKNYPLEIHYVHKADDGALAVLGIFAEEGAENKAMNQIIEVLPKEPNLSVMISAPLELAALLPKIDSTFRYPGSLTTPPCTEGVRWNVALRPMTMSKAQIGAITAKFKERNARPLQPLKARELIFDTVDG